MKIRWCVIGAGGIADRRTIPGILLDPNNQLVAVMDKNPAVAETIGKKYGVKYYDDENKMLDENACDAVYIGTPVAFHYDQAMNVLKHGANVFIEKPISMHAEEGAKLVEAYKKAGKLIFVGYMMKYHNLHVKAKKLISEDGIGEVTNIRLQFSCWYPDIPGAWRQKKALGGGGAIIDLGVHCIELAEYVLGEKIVGVKSFYGTKTFNYEVDDSAIIAFKTESGVFGHIDVNFNIPDKASESKMEIYGSKGYVICKGTLGQEEVGTLSYLYSPQGDYSATQTRTTDKPKTYRGGKKNIYSKQIQAFTKQLQTGKFDYAYSETAVHVQQIVDGIYAEKQ